MNGDRWQLPDGQHGIECGRTERLLNVIPILPAAPHMGAPILVWRAACIKQPSRYHRGAIPAEPQPTP